MEPSGGGQKTYCNLQYQKMRLVVTRQAEPFRRAKSLMNPVPEARRKGRCWVLIPPSVGGPLCSERLARTDKSAALFLREYQLVRGCLGCYSFARYSPEKAKLAMSRTSRIALWLTLLASTVSAAGLAEARGGFNPDCKVPKISLCPGCTVNVNIVVLRDHECHINYGSLGAMHPQKILVSPKRGRYWAANETSTSYSPTKGFLGSDYFETRFEYEMLNGSLASATLKAGVEVVPHF